MEGTLARHVPGVPGIQSNIPAPIPMLYPCHTEHGVPFSQLQKHTSFMHDWKKWWRVSAMTILPSFGIFACSLGLFTKISAQIPLCWARSENPIQTHTPKRLEVGQ